MIAAVVLTQTLIRLDEDDRLSSRNSLTNEVQEMGDHTCLRIIPECELENWDQPNCFSFSFTNADGVATIEIDARITGGCALISSRGSSHPQTN
jgi:hypothetical protein